jgi:hypothetical protein
MPLATKAGVCFGVEMSEREEEGGFFSFCVLGFLYNPKCYGERKFKKFAKAQSTKRRERKREDDGRRGVRGRGGGIRRRQIIRTNNPTDVIKTSLATRFRARKQARVAIFRALFRGKLLRHEQRVSQVRREEEEEEKDEERR